MSAMKSVAVLMSVRVAEEGNLHGREIVKGTDDEIPADLFDQLAAAGYVEALGGKKGGKKTKPNPDEMRDAILADLAKLSNEDLAKVVDAEKIAVVDGDSKDVVLGKIADARMASQG